MKNKIYFFLILLIMLEIFISQSSPIIKEVFPFYPYDKNMATNFEEFCMNMKLKKDCIIENILKTDIQKIKKISYDFIKSYNNEEKSMIIASDFFLIL